MLTAILIEDDRRMTEIMTRKIEGANAMLNYPLRLVGNVLDFVQDAQHTGYVDFIEFGIKMIDTIKPDLVFLDIELNYKHDGFHLLTRFHNRPCPVPFSTIVVTSYPNLALQATEYGAFDAFHKISTTEQLAILLKNFLSFRGIATDINTQDTISIKENLNVPKHRIAYVRANDDYVVLYFSDPKNGVINQLYTQTLKDLLSEVSSLVQVHKSYAINPFHVVKITNRMSERDSSLIMSDGRVIPLSRSFRAKTLDLIKSINPVMID